MSLESNKKGQSMANAGIGECAGLVRRGARALATGLFMATLAACADDGSFPNLSTVPDERPEVSSEAERTELKENLQADRSQARYASEDANAATAEGDLRSTLAPAETYAPGSGRIIAVIYFAHGSAKLDSRDREVLQAVKGILDGQGGRLLVTGHASQRTATMNREKHRLANFEISFARATNVSEALQKMGVPGDQIASQARGDDQPVYHEFMPTGEAGNRRAEIYLVQ